MARLLMNPQRPGGPSAGRLGATLQALRLQATIVVAVGLASTASAQTSTTLYKSTGQDGKTVYSDRPDPRAQDTKTLTFENLPASPLSAQTLAYIEQLQKSADERATAVPPSEVVLFTAARCGYCKQAKAYLAARQVPYREFDIGSKEGLVAFARAGGKSGVPLLLANGQRVSGFSAAAYGALFLPRK